MRKVSLMALMMFSLLGCVSEPFREILEIRDSPVVLTIRTHTLQVLESYPDGRMQVDAKIIAPDEYSEKRFSIVVDDVPSNSDFRRIGETWKINFDTFSFVSIDSAGISFWTFEVLDPIKTNSNKLVESTETSSETHVRQKEKVLLMPNSFPETT